MNADDGSGFFAIVNEKEGGFLIRLALVDEFIRSYSGPGVERGLLSAPRFAEPNVPSGVCRTMARYERSTSYAFGPGVGNVPNVGTDNTALALFGNE